MNEHTPGKSEANQEKDEENQQHNSQEQAEYPNKGTLAVVTISLCLIVFVFALVMMPKQAKSTLVRRMTDSLSIRTLPLLLQRSPVSLSILTPSGMSVGTVLHTSWSPPRSNLFLVASSRSFPSGRSTSLLSASSLLDRSSALSAHGHPCLSSAELSQA
jgi:hypothetical protein